MAANHKIELKDFLALTVTIAVIVGVLSGFVMANFSQRGLWIRIEDIEQSVARLQGQDNGDGSNLAYASEEQAVIEAVKKASPAVVSIIVSKNVPVIEKYYENLHPFDGNDFFNQFFSPFSFEVPRYRQNGTQEQEIGGGTGFIVSANGLILTNKHVVGEQDAQYTVLTNDGEKWPAQVLARDPVQDLAILKVEQNDLPVLALADSDQVQIGQTVIAIGNALGEYRNTVSTGIVSGLSRSITAAAGTGQTEQIEEVIQTDAAINFGNSGGPLLNLQGQVIGINVAMAQGAQNIGFAIPINKAKQDIESVKQTGQISYAFLGIRYVMLSSALAQDNGLNSDYGAWIVGGANGEPAIVSGSAADKAGLKENDIILQIDDEKLDAGKDLAKVIQNYSPGDKLSLRVWRQGQELDMKVTLGQR